MIGLACLGLAFVLAGAALRLADPTTRVHLAMRRRDGEYLSEVLRFEERGGRVEDIGHLLATLRRTMRVGWVGIGIKFVLAVSLFYLLRPWPLIPALVLGLLIGAGGFVSEWHLRTFKDRFEHEPEPSGELPWRLLGVTVSVALATLGVWFLFQGVVLVNSSQWVAGLLSMLSGVGTVHVLHLPARRIELRLRRRRTPVFNSETPSEALLYLRSFRSDSAQLFSPIQQSGIQASAVGTWQYFEEVIAAVCRPLRGHQLVAIGELGVNGSQLGATRSYWADDEWQQAVIQTASRCSGVILLAGTTKGLDWELGMLKELNQTSKLLVVFPPGGAKATRDAYRRLMADAHQPEMQLPRSLDPALIAVAFDEDGFPIHYTGPGRHWSTYSVVIIHFFMTQDRVGSFSAQGTNLAVFNRLTSRLRGEPEGAEAEPSPSPSKHRDKFTLGQKYRYIASFMAVDDDEPLTAGEAYVALSQQALDDGHRGLSLRLLYAGSEFLREAGQTKRADDLCHEVISRAPAIGPSKAPWSQDWLSGPDLSEAAHDDLVDSPLINDQKKLRALWRSYRQMCVDAGKRDEAADVLARWAEFERDVGNTDDAAHKYGIAAQEFEKRGNLLKTARAKRFQSRLLSYDEAQPILEEALRIATTHGEDNVLAEIQQVFAEAAEEFGDLDRAEELFASARQSAHRSGDVKTECQVRYGQADIWFRRGQLESALDELQASSALATEAGNLAQASRHLAARAGMLFESDRVVEALSDYTRALEVAPEAADADPAFDQALGKLNALAGRMRNEPVKGISFDLRSAVGFLDAADSSSLRIARTKRDLLHRLAMVQGSNSTKDALPVHDKAIDLGRGVLAHPDATDADRIQLTLLLLRAAQSRQQIAPESANELAQEMIETGTTDLLGSNPHCGDRAAWCHQALWVVANTSPSDERVEAWRRTVEQGRSMMAFHHDLTAELLVAYDLFGLARGLADPTAAGSSIAEAVEARAEGLKLLRGWQGTYLRRSASEWANQLCGYARLLATMRLDEAVPTAFEALEAARHACEREENDSLATFTHVALSLTELLAPISPPVGIYREMYERHRDREPDEGTHGVLTGMSRTLWAESLAPEFVTPRRAATAEWVAETREAKTDDAESERDLILALLAHSRVSRRQDPLDSLTTAQEAASISRGRHERDFDDSELRHEYTVALNNWGCSLHAAGSDEALDVLNEAVAYARVAVRLEPDSDRAATLLGTSLANRVKVGRTFGEAEDPAMLQQAIQALRRVAASTPDSIGSQRDLAWVLALDDNPEAQREAQALLQPLRDFGID